MLRQCFEEKGRAAVAVLLEEKKPLRTVLPTALYEVLNESESSQEKL